MKLATDIARNMNPLPVSRPIVGLRQTLCVSATSQQRLFTPVVILASQARSCFQQQNVHRASVAVRARA